MPAITITDLENAKTDVDHIADLANSQNLTAIDRLGTQKKTLAGVLASIGYEAPVAYAGGISFTTSDTTKTVEESGVVYAPFPSALPFTTSGTFVGDDDARFYPIQFSISDTPQKVDDITGLLSEGTYNNEIRIPIGYHPNSDKGGDPFYWDASLARSNHNGGTIISPTCTWDGTQGDLSAFLDGTNETSGASNGCWVRIYDIATPQMFGAVADSVTNDTDSLVAADALGEVEVYGGIIRVQSNIALTADYRFISGGIIAPDSIYTITWSGAIDAGNYRILDGSFQLTDIHKVDEVKIEWFGAVSADINTDMSDTTLANANAKAIRQANQMTKFSGTGGIYRTPVLKIGSGLYIVDDDDNDGVIIDLGSYATVLGDGWSSVLRPVNSAKAFSMIACTVDGANNIILDNMMIYGEASQQTNVQTALRFTPPSQPIIYTYVGRNFHVKEMSGYGILVEGVGLDNCTLEPRLVRDSSLGNLYVTACDRLVVQGGIYRTAKAGSNGATFDGIGCSSAIIRNNQFDENNNMGLFVSNVTGRFQIIGNRIAGNATSDGLHVDRCDNCQIVGNQIEQNGRDGILIDRCDNIEVGANHIRSNSRIGILVSTVGNSSIHDNTVLTNGLSATNTYDGINLQSNSDSNIVTGNLVRGSDHRYGIAIDTSDCNNNYVFSNDLLNSGASGSLLDNGVGTDTTSTNRL